MLDGSKILSQLVVRRDYVFVYVSQSRGTSDSKTLATNPGQAIVPTRAHGPTVYGKRVGYPSRHTEVCADS
jgi:hypothetical protein